MLLQHRYAEVGDLLALAIAELADRPPTTPILTERTLQLVANVYVTATQEGVLQREIEAALNIAEERLATPLVLRVLLLLLRQADELWRLLGSESAKDIINKVSPRATDLAESAGDRVALALCRYYAAVSVESTDPAAWEMNLKLSAVGFCEQGAIVSDQDLANTLFGRAALVYLTLGQYYLDRNLAVSAQDALDSARELLSKLNDNASLVLCLRLLAQCHLAHHAPDAAIAALTDAGQLCAKDTTDAAEIAFELALAFARHGRRQETLRHLQLVEDTLQRARADRKATELLFKTARHYEQAADWPAAARCYQATHELALELGFVDASIAAMFAHARMKFSQGHWADAVNSLELVTLQADEWGMQDIGDQASAYLDVARLRSKEEPGR